jgi:hypothetical protein
MCQTNPSGVKQDGFRSVTVFFFFGGSGDRVTNDVPEQAVTFGALVKREFARTVGGTASEGVA